ncbi:MAG: radical SAM protein [Deltaproteobacteria bacterium]|nr:radical SAM protein [Deltaproteobacteria bacterium]
MPQESCESPEYVRMSTATAMELGFVRGRFYRQARNLCVNLLLNYREGCFANCAYCGLARKRPGNFADKSFIKVEWPAGKVSDIADRVREKQKHLGRVCISMVTNPRAVADTLLVAAQFRSRVSLPISVLCAPTILSGSQLENYRDAGIQMLGVAVDTAHPDLFSRYRGSGVRGPHKWDHYWDTVRTAVSLFGKGSVSVHLMVGLGESERDLAYVFQRVHDEGALIHLFSFFAESASALAHLPQPPWSTYLRLQLARWLVEKEIRSAGEFEFDDEGRIIGFGLGKEQLSDLVDERVPFMTSGCPGPEGAPACNRPFGNCLPGVRQWNYPYLPNDEEMAKVRSAVLESAGCREPQRPSEKDRRWDESTSSSSLGSRLRAGGDV